MDYSAIIKKSWHYFSKYRYLWWLGILGALTEGGGGGSAYQFNSSDLNWPQLEQNQSVKQTFEHGLSGLPKVLGAEDRYQLWSRFVDFINDYWMVLLFGVLVLLIIQIIIIYISYAAKAGLILSVNKLEDGDCEGDFKSAYRSGQTHAWRLFGLSVLLALLFVAVLLTLSIPVATFFLLGNTVGMVIGAIILVIVLVILFAFALALGLLTPIAQRSLVIGNLRIIAAFTQARLLMTRKLGQLILTYLINIVLGIVYSLIIGLVMILPVISIVVLMVMKGSFDPNNISWYFLTIGPIFLLLVIMMIFANGLYYAFISAYWTISYRDLTNLVEKSR